MSARWPSTTSCDRVVEGHGAVFAADVEHLRAGCHRVHGLDVERLLARPAFRFTFFRAGLGERTVDDLLELARAATAASGLVAVFAYSTASL